MFLPPWIDLVNTLLLRPGTVHQVYHAVLEEYTLAKWDRVWLTQFLHIVLHGLPPLIKPTRKRPNRIPPNEIHVKIQKWYYTNKRIRAEGKMQDHRRVLWDRHIL